MHASSPLPPALHAYLEDFVSRARRLALVRSAGVGGATFLGWMIAWCLIDRWAHFAAAPRVVALGAGATMVMALLLRPLLALRRRADWVAAAAEVERTNPQLGQRLVTVTSRLLGSPAYRGSDEILRRLAREVDEQVRGAHAFPFRSAARAAAPWGACFVLTLLVLGLCRVPDLGFPQLARRFVAPMSGVAPVTTTQLSVVPGNCDVTQSRPLRIEADATRAGDSPVTLFVSGDGKSWSRSTMVAAGLTHYVFTLASVDRDLRYYVTAGDAQSPRYQVRTLRKPAVAQFKIRYIYPPYTQIPPATAVNTDGRLEAPTGTEAYVTVTATEPLQSALLTVGGDKILMSRTDDEHSRTARLLVLRDTSYWLDLISTREVAGGGPGTMKIHALPDLAPRVRVTQPEDGLRLAPRDVVPISYEVLDDYGIRSLAIRAQVNTDQPVQVPLPIRGDWRRQEDTFEFDLASLPLNVGDVLTLSVTATDSASQRSDADPIRVLVSPHSVDVAAHRRVAELQNAAQLAGLLAQQFEAAAKAQDAAETQPDRKSLGYLTTSGRGDRDLTAAAQTATLLRQALLRAVTQSDAPSLTTALAAAVDDAESSAAAAEDSFRQSGAPAGMGNTARDKLRHVVERAKELRDRVAMLWQGVQADQLLRDRDNLAEVQKRPAPADPAAAQRREETIQRARREVEAVIKQIAVDSGAPNVDEQLRAKADASRNLCTAAKPVDFVAAVRDWAQQMQQDPQTRLGLEARLSAAAQVEAIRPDADLVRARDLELASRAAAALTAAARTGGAAPKALDEFASAAAVVLGPHDPNQPAAAQALRQLASWAGDPEAAAASTNPSTVPAPTDRPREAEQLAMQAAALGAAHRYADVAAMDRALARRLSENRRHDPSTGPATAEAPALGERFERHREAVEQSLATAQRMDALRGRQDQVTQQTTEGDAKKTAEMAGSQEAVAIEIAEVQRRQGRAGEEPTWRDRAAAELLHAQEQLAALPLRLSEVQSAAAARAAAMTQANDAKKARDAAPPEQRTAAAHSAEQAEKNAAKADEQLQKTLAAIIPDVAHGLSLKLAPFAPESADARAAIDDRLSPSLAAVGQAAKAGDVAGIERAAGDARQAIELAQRHLAAAQDAVMARDPLLAAKWYARAAADSLSLQPPDVSGARAHQQKASAALGRAWEQSVRRAASERLAELPALQTVLSPAPPSADPNGVIAVAGGKFSAAREWGRIRPPESPDVIAPLHDSDPVGFEEAIKLYFQAIGKAQGGMR